MLNTCLADPREATFFTHHAAFLPLVTNACSRSNERPSERTALKNN
jgi:hypothetical protein